MTDSLSSSPVVGWREAGKARRDEIRATGDMRKVLDRCGLLEMADTLDRALDAVEQERDALREAVERVLALSYVNFDARLILRAALSVAVPEEGGEK